MYIGVMLVSIVKKTLANFTKSTLLFEHFILKQQKCMRFFCQVIPNENGVNANDEGEELKETQFAEESKEGK